jgi:hypothetical protein
MELLVNIQIGESSVCYKVKREIDGIYIAKLINTRHYNNRNSPPQIFLHKGEDGWQSDHYDKQIGLHIGRKIDEALKRSLYLNK